MPEVAEAPPQTTEVPNPVLPPDFQEQAKERSKSIFNEQKAKVTPQAQEAPETTETNDEGKEAGKGKKAATEPPAQEKWASTLPEDIFTPAEETKPEPPVNEAIAEIEAMTLPKNAKPEQVASFGKLKESAKKAIETQTGKISELQKQLEGATKNSDIEALQKKLDAAEKKAAETVEQLERTSFEQSPRFKQQFTEAETAAVDGAKATLEGSEITPETVTQLIHASQKDRLKILRDAGADAELIAAVSVHLTKYDDVQRGKTKALENWKVENAKYQEEQEQARSQATNHRKQLEDKVWVETVSKLDLLPLRKSKDNEGWNTRAVELDSKAKQIYNGDGVDLPTVAATIRKGVAYDALNEVVDQLAARNKQLAEENANLKSASPGGVVTTRLTDGAEDHSKLSREESAKLVFNQQKGS